MKKKQVKQRDWLYPGLSKTLTIMKLTGLFLVIGMITVSAKTMSQNSTVTINLKNAQLSKVFDEIEEQTDYVLFYKKDVVDDTKTVSVNAKNEKVKDVLDRVLEDEDVSIKMVENSIIIAPDTKADAMQEQTQKITGQITDTKGEPMPGVSVVVKGTTNGTITDMNGKYELNAGSTSTLVYSFIGFKSQEVLVGNQTNLKVVMEDEVFGMDEVVVVGYGSVSRKNFTGSVAGVKMENSPIANSPKTDIMDALRGNVPGINVSQQQGAGQSPSLLVRGQKSITGGSDPLIVLDGVIFMGSMRDIDPSTIESINVLKDATSVAAYGSRAANGVVMITTKKGVIGKPVFNFESSLTAQTWTDKPELLSAEDYIKKVNLVQGLAEDADPTTWMSSFEKENYKAGKTTDWMDLVSRTGILQNYAASVSGATEGMNYYVAGSHTNQEGVLVGDDYKRYALTSRFKFDVTDWLEIGLDGNYSFSDYSGPSTYNIYQALRLSPYGRAYRTNGELEKYPITQGIYITNPLWGITDGSVEDEDTYNTYRLNGHYIVKVPWVKGLNFRMNYMHSGESVHRDYFTKENYYIQQGDSDDRYSTSSINALLTSANGYMARTNNRSWVWDNILSYQKQIGKHFFDATAVYTRDEYHYQYSKVTGSNFTSLGNTNLGVDGLAYATVHKIESINATKHTNIGYLGRFNYSFDDKYHLTGSVRRDGSSVFGSANKWGVFPSVGAAWTASNESFLNNNQYISYLKLKASWGKNGNQSLNPYGTLSTMALGQTGGLGYEFGNSGTISYGQNINKLGNPELGWETTTAFNGGFVLGLLEDKITLETDVYFSRTEDQIFSRTIPVMTGFTSISATMGQVNNHGVEITVRATPVKTTDFEWNTTMSFWQNRSILKKLYGTDADGDGKEDDDISSGYFINESLGAIYGYKSDGIVQESDATYIANNGTKAGNPKYADLDGDNVITTKDRTILGYSKENFRMSFANTFDYKDFEFYFLFTGIFGGKDYYQSSNYYAYATMTDVYTDNNFNHEWWTPENASNKYPSATFSNDGKFKGLQSRGFVRLQDVSLSYTFNQPWVKKMAINKLKMYVAMKNVFTITNWEGGDPEISQTLGGYGSYNYGYPLATSYCLGLNLTF